MTRNATISGSAGRSFSLPRGVAGLALLLAAGCGGGPDVAAADAQIAKMLPDSTVAVVRITSIDELNQHQRAITRDLGEREQGLDAVDMMTVAGLPLGDASLLDTSLPIVIAVTSKRATPPTIAAIVPSKDAAAQAKALNARSITAAVEGNYLAIPVFGTYKPAATASDLLSKLPAGTVSLHADVETLAKTYKVAIDSAIDLFEKQIVAEMERTAPEMDMEPVAELYGSIGRAIAYSAKTLQLGVRYEDGMFDLDVELDAKDGSSMSGWSAPSNDMRALAQGMTGKGTIEGLFQFPMSKLQPRIEEMMDAISEIYPEEFRETMKGLVAAYEGVYRQIESGAYIEGDLFGPGGMQMTAHMMPADPDSFGDMMAKLMRSESLQKMGVTATVAEPTTVDGTTVRDVELAIDSEKLMALSGNSTPPEATGMFEAMFGKAIQLRLAQQGKRAVMTLGAPRKEAATQALAATDGSWSPHVQRALTTLQGCNPMFIERIDFAAMMGAMFSVMLPPGAKAPAFPEDATANLVIYMGITGDKWRGGLSMDIAGLGEVGQAMQPR